MWRKNTNNGVEKMIPLEQQHNNQSVGFGDQEQFSIEMSGKMFDMIMLKIYTDPMTAVIREITCNGNDAHKEANNDEPIIVHMPNHLEPYFEVIDFGAGLTPEQVRTVFIRVGKSTKEMSNSVTGCLGVGSKSPFALSDSFTVVSRQGGMKNSYVCSKDSRNLPTLATVGVAHPTDERDGLTIRVSVNPDDFDDFYKKAGIVFRVYENQPIIEGCEEDEVDMKPLEHDDYSVNGFISADERIQDYNPTRKGGYQHGSNGYRFTPVFLATQGGIAYPIRSHKFIEAGGEPGLMGFLESLEGIIVFPFDIGSIGFMPSREELEYNEPTVKALTAKIEAFRNDFVAEFSKKMAVATDRWEAYQIIREFDGVCSHTGSRPKGRWSQDDEVVIPTRTEQRESHFSGNYSVEVPLWDMTQLRLDSNDRSKKEVVVTSLRLFNLHHNKGRGSTAIVIVDKPSDYWAKIRRLIMDSPTIRRAIVIKSTMDVAIDPKMISKEFTMPVMLTSQLASIPYNPSKAPGIFSYSYSNWDRDAIQSRYAETSNIDPKGYYFLMKGFSPNDFSHESLRDLYRQAPEGTKVYGVRTAHAAKVKHLKPLSELRDSIQNEALKPKYRDMIVKGSARQEMIGSTRMILSEMRTAIGHHPYFRELDIIRDAARLLHKTRGSNDVFRISVDSQSWSESRSELNVEKFTYVCRVKAMEENLLKRYPLLRSVATQNLSPAAKSDLVEYVKAGPSRRAKLTKTSPLRNRAKRKGLTFRK